MEQVIHANRPGRWLARGRVGSFRKLRRALHRGILTALVALLGAFVLTYPALRLGYLGPVPEDFAMEAAIGLVAGLLAAAGCLLERPSEA